MACYPGLQKSVLSGTAQKFLILLVATLKPLLPELAGSILFHSTTRITALATFRISNSNLPSLVVPLKVKRAGHGGARL